MSKEKVHNYLEDLGKEIDNLEIKDEETKEKLTGLVSEIRQSLDNEEDTSNHIVLVENLQKQIEQFEVKHPAITSVLNQIMVLLSNMGI